MLAFFMNSQPAWGLRAGIEKDVLDFRRPNFPYHHMRKAPGGKNGEIGTLSGRTISHAGYTDYCRWLLFSGCPHNCRKKLAPFARATNAISSFVCLRGFSMA